MVCEALIPYFSLQDVKSFSVQQSNGEDICLIHLYLYLKCGIFLYVVEPKEEVKEDGAEGRES